MISVVIPALDAERHLTRTLAALVPAAVDGLVREVIVADGGSKDATLAIAEDAGAVVVRSPAGRGQQLAAGGRSARFPWLLFLHADTVLEPGWEQAALLHIEREAPLAAERQRAAAFTFALDDPSPAARFLAAMVGFRSRLLKLPFGDQGLLISRNLYDAVGGYDAIPIMEDVDLVRRLGRRRIEVLSAKAVTSSERYRTEGYLRRIVRNQRCLALYYAGVAPDRVAELYQDVKRA